MEDGSRLKMCLFSDSQAPSAFTEKNLTFFGHFYDSCLQSIILPNMGKNEDIDFGHFRNYQVSRKNSKTSVIRFAKSQVETFSLADKVNIIFDLLET